MTASDCFLNIRHGWDGSELPPTEHASVEVSLHHIVPAWGSDEDEATGGLGHRELHIAIDAPFFGDPAPPPTNGPRRCYDGLWQHEVVELFIGHLPGREAPSARSYIELEFGPHGHALGISFAGYRHRLELFEIQCDTFLRGSRWQVRAVLPFHVLPPLPWNINAFAMHGPVDARMYAAANPAGPDVRPDFHDSMTWLRGPSVWPVP